MHLMRPEGSWRPIVTVEIDEHNTHGTILVRIPLGSLVSHGPWICLIFSFRLLNFTSLCSQSKLHFCLLFRPSYTPRTINYWPDFLRIQLSEDTKFTLMTTLLPTKKSRISQSKLEPHTTRHDDDTSNLERMLIVVTIHAQFFHGLLCTHVTLLGLSHMLEQPLRTTTFTTCHIFILTFTWQERVWTTNI